MVADGLMRSRSHGLLPVVGADVVDKHIREEASVYECKDEIDDMYA